MKLKAIFYQNPVGFLSALAILVMAVISFYFNKFVFIALAVSFAVVCILSLMYSLLSLKNTKKYVSAVNSALLGDSNGAVEDFPLPAVMCDEFGNIVWYNDKFSAEVIECIDTNELTIAEFIDDFSFEKLSQERIVNASYGENEYTAFIVKVNSESKPMLCMYLFDDTALKEVAYEYTYSRPFVMLMLVDNIEQLSRKLTDSRFAQVLSGIETKIEDWLKNENVILKKIGNGNFLVIGEKRNLDKLCADKFTILSEIRNYKYKDELVNSTLSVGVGNGADLAECEAKAKKALDMALGRGGDQAAVSTAEGYTYFGGMADRANDKSKVSPRQTAANISTLLKKYEKVIIMGHKFSDYDALGSAIGMQFFADSCGLESYIVADNKTTLAGSLLEFAHNNGVKNIISPSKAEDVCDDDTVVIVVDTQRKQLLESTDVYDLAGATIVIDHHRRSDDYIDDADISYSSPSSSSTCEMVTELIEYSLVSDDISETIATSLLSGIVLDTKDFVLRTSQRTFEAAGYLRDRGADTVRVRKLFSIDSEMAEIKNAIVSEAKYHNGFMVSSTNSENKNIRVITSLAADEMLKIDGVRASFVITKLSPLKYQISARSLGEENVQLIMENLDGGGHNTMAAAQVKASSMNDVKQKLLDAIDKYVNNK